MPCILFLISLGIVHFAVCSGTLYLSFKMGTEFMIGKRCFYASLIFFSLCVLGCTDTPHSLKLELVEIEHQFKALRSVVKKLSENQALMNRQWLSDDQKPMEIQVSKVLVEHEKRPFEEVLIIRAQLKAHPPEYFNNKKHYAILEYFIEIPEREWKLSLIHI